MKKLISLTIALLVTVAALAQHSTTDMKVKHSSIGTGMPVYFEFGPRIGINYANITGLSADTQGIPGFLIGGFAEMRTAPWFGLSIDVMYSAQGVKYKNENTLNVNSYAIAPVLANFYFFERLALKVGVQPGLLVDAQYMPEGGNRYSIVEDMNRFEFSIPVGASYTFNLLNAQWQLDARYNFGITTVYKNTGGRNSVASLSVAMKF